ncbi:MAG: hypothetical protein EXX96DRAFT_540003 [Benjaminiella poitrasii]|nr:MAG: hypothetical protein EXX96DRAFT_540003 [Benjaminiella poitrasii]
MNTYFSTNTSTTTHMLQHSVHMASEEMKQQELIQVHQNLAPQQFQYEFPPRSLALQVSEVEEDKFNFFDESSFTSHSTTTEDLLDQYLDSLSSSSTTPDRINWDNSSFVFPDYNNVTEEEAYSSSVHPHHRDDQNTTIQSNIIVMQFTRNKPPVIVFDSTDDQSTMIDGNNTSTATLESTSHFLPLHANGITSTIMANRVHVLERRVEQERAMRMAFEKTMDDMTVLMDHQHQQLHQRLQQEVEIRESYERKMEDVMRQSERMARLVEQVQQESERQRQLLQSQLKEAVQEIAILKKRTQQQYQVRSSTMVSKTSSQAAAVVNRLSTVSRPSRAATTTVKNTTMTKKKAIAI